MNQECLGVYNEIYVIIKSAVFFLRASLPFPMTPFFMPQHSKLIGYQSAILEKGIKPLFPRYSYQGDTPINPAYQDSQNINTRLDLNEKRIWVLREDLVLATGVKNAYQKQFNYQGFESAFKEGLDWTSFVNIKDRYGHPSLTLDHQDKQIGVYYAGYLMQESEQLTLFLASGRYAREDLSLEETQLLESYISLLFQEAYGPQKTVFYCGMRPYEFYPSDESYYQHLGLFFNNNAFNPTSLLEDEPKRTYFDNKFN